MAELKAAQAGFRSARGEYYSKEQNIFLKEIEIYLSCVEAKEKYYTKILKGHIAS